MKQEKINIEFVEFQNSKISRKLHLKNFFSYISPKLTKTERHQQTSVKQ